MKELDEYISSEFVIREAIPTPPAGPPTIEAMSAADLDKADFAPLVEAVSGLIVEGLTLFCGSSKIGKSWAMLQVCAAVAAGKPVWGRNTTQGAVLYLALEDSPRRLKKRLEQMGILHNSPLFFQTRAISVDAGLIPALEAWLTAHPDAKLVVVDTLQKVRGAVPARANVYGSDYDFIAPLKALADKYHIALVLIHHLNKLRDVSDPFDRISGSTGLMGAADTAILIERNRGEDTAKVTYQGRDVWGDSFEMTFENCRWRVCDPAMLARERYEKADAVRAIKCFMAQESIEDIRRITFQDLGGFAQDHNFFIGTRPQEVRRNVEAYAEQLQRYDGIRIDYCDRVYGKTGRGFAIRRFR